ncbi:MAG TPA: cbb3-type cytochrome oxidase assembly protein CcoS [Marinagarivorans sp.]
MESLYLLIPVAIIVVAVSVAVFFWAVKSGQYDDLDTEGHRILFDDDTPPQYSADQSTADQSTADQPSSAEEAPSALGKSRD